MVTGTHFIQRCGHGTIVAQCRCPSPNKTVRIVPCPPDCPAVAAVVYVVRVCRGSGKGTLTTTDREEAVKYLTLMLDGGATDVEIERVQRD